MSKRALIYRLQYIAYCNTPRHILSNLFLTFRPENQQSPRSSLTFTYNVFALVLMS